MIGIVPFVRNFLKLGSVEKAAEAAADAALAAGKRSGVAAELGVGDRAFTGVSGEVVSHSPQLTGAFMRTPQAQWGLGMNGARK